MKKVIKQIKPVLAVAVGVVVGLALNKLFGITNKLPEVL